MAEKKNKKRVVIAMSGGVDSSVAAALLKKQGFEVAGVFMRFWAETQNKAELKDAELRGNENLCCSEGAEKAARAVAAKLKIPFYVFNFAKEFKKEVVDYFLAEQAVGRTPNPCVVCNKKIKFGMLFDKTLGVGADFLATGHYARIKKIKKATPPLLPKAKAYQKSKIKITIQNSKFIYKLFQAKDKQKDQSYFLHQLNQKQLSRIIFPLADYAKNEVIKLAKKWRLPYRQEESFDLCFVSNDAESFIKRHLKLKVGKIIRYSPHPSPSPYKGEGQPARRSFSEGEGEVLGEHQGLPLYTIGQRKSIPVAQGPWWVIKKDERKNILYVSNNEQDLYSGECFVSQMNWIGGVELKLPMKVWAKIRYKNEAAEAIINQKGHTTPFAKGKSLPKIKNQKLLVVKFEEPQRAITPGQSTVFYTKAGEVLGGGVIE